MQPAGSFILGIDTSSRTASIALIQNGAVVAERRFDGRKAAELLLLEIHELRQSVSNYGMQQIDGVAIAFGPGSFTGIRIGIAVAQGLSLGLGVPLFGVSCTLAWAISVVERYKYERDTVLGMEITFPASPTEIFRQRFSIKAVEEERNRISVTADSDLIVSLRDADNRKNIVVLSEEDGEMVTVECYSSALLASRNSARSLASYVAIAAARCDVGGDQSKASIDVESSYGYLFIRSDGARDLVPIYGKRPNARTIAERTHYRLEPEVPPRK